MDEETVTITVPKDEWDAQVARVNMLCDLVSSMMKAMAQTPFAAMLPPDIMQQIRSLP